MAKARGRWGNWGARLAGFLLCLLVQIPLAAAAPEVLGVRAGKQLDMTRLVIDLSEKVDYKLFSLSDPYRLVIDFPSIDWKIGSETVNRIVRETPMVKAFRYGQFDGNTARIVIELNGPVSVRRDFLLNPVGPFKYRFVLDLANVDDATFQKEVEATKSLRPPDPKSAKPILTALRPPPPPGRGEERTIPRRSAIRTVVIDPGHGGVDPGAIGVNGYYEKNITLAVARELARQLNATRRYKAVLTRDKDSFVALRERVAIARNAGADLFISLHADSHADSSTRGASIYTLSNEASDREAAALAAKENKADVIAGLDLVHQDRNVASILIDLAQRETMNRSKTYAEMVVQQMSRSGILLLPRTHRYAGFAVLTAPDVPAVLIELGYLSNAADERLLRTKSHQQKLAQSIVKATDRFFSTRPPPGTTTAAAPN